MMANKATPGNTGVSNSFNESHLALLVERIDSIQNAMIKTSTGHFHRTYSAM